MLRIGLRRFRDQQYIGAQQHPLDHHAEAVVKILESVGRLTGLCHERIDLRGRHGPPIQQRRDIFDERPGTFGVGRIGCRRLARNQVFAAALLDDLRGHLGGGLLIHLQLRLRQASRRCTTCQQAVSARQG